MNLMEGLVNELKRNRELLSLYRSIGSAGMFGASFIEQDIKVGENAITNSDTIEMIKIYDKLKKNE